ncbi:MAG TPA: FHA domain-containing protein, partial [Isosphaeraceae bacterium]|nr:FHA domain-containing protein [Isosphaeraceae bacterium]
MNDLAPIKPAIELRQNGIAVATYPLDAGRLSIGHSPSSDIRLENNCVSRCHAAIERRPDGSFVLIDLDSRGGTWLDGWQVTPYEPVPLSDLSRIRLVDYELVFHQPVSEPRKWPDIAQRAGEDDRFMILKILKSCAARNPCRSAARVDDWSGAYRRLLEVSRILGGGSDLVEQLERALDDLLVRFPGAEGGIIMAPDQDGILSPLARSFRDRVTRARSVALSGSLARQALDASEAMLVTEVPMEPPIDDWDIALIEPIRAWLCVPLLGLEGRSVGLIQLFSAAFQPDFKAVQLARLRWQDNAVVDPPRCIPLKADDLDRLAERTQSLGLAMEFHRIEQQAGDAACRQIQATLDHAECRELPGYDFAGLFVPGREFRGNLYEFIPRVPDRAGGETPPGGTIVMGEVAGKGIRTALIMADAQLEIRRLLLAGLELPDVLSRVNWLLADAGGKGNRVCVALADLDSRAHQVTAASAGHDPLVVRRATGMIENLDRQPEAGRATAGQQSGSCLPYIHGKPGS